MVTVPLRFHLNFRPTAVGVILGRKFRVEQKLTAEMLHVIVLKETFKVGHAVKLDYFTIQT